MSRPQAENTQKNKWPYITLRQGLPNHQESSRKGKEANMPHKSKYGMRPTKKMKAKAKKKHKK